MLLLDVNVLLYAHREGVPDHARYRAWVEAALDGPEPLGFSEFILSSVVRIATRPRVFERPSTLDEVLSFADQIRLSPNAVPIVPGSRHWSIFTSLCREVRATGNLVPDAYFAALAIESGSEWITDDRDYRLFPGLRWRHPLR